MEYLFVLPGRLFLSLVHYFGQLGSLVWEILRSPFQGKISPHQTTIQMVNIGFGSQLVVVVTGAFTGAVVTALIYFKLSSYGLETTVGGIVAVAMARELGPVLTALMVAGRVGASMTAEIGSMKVSEQIDALRVLAIHPIDWLVMPRLVAMMISMPLLIAEAVVFGIGASYYMATFVFPISPADYWTMVSQYCNLNDFIVGMIKGFVFGIIIVVVSCHQGLTVTNGAVGVGRATTSAVVYSNLLCLVVNFFLTMFLNYFFPIGEAR